MSINKKLIHFNKKSDFDKMSKATSVNDTAADILYSSIVFIKDTLEIWTHGLIYPADSYTKSELDTLLGDKANRNDLESISSKVNNVENQLFNNWYMLFKGHVGDNGGISALPSIHNAGWTYKVSKAGTYAGIKCEVGDLIVCVRDGRSNNDSDWTVVQANIDGAVISSGSNVVPNSVAIFEDNSGTTITSSNYTIQSSVPQSAEFTDTPSDWNETDASSKAYIKNRPEWIKGATKPVYTKAEVGLENVDNTSDADKPISAALLKAINDVEQANLKTYLEFIVHRASKMHIPSGGQEGLLLAWEADGKALWKDPFSIFTGLEELLAYGVEWQDNVADPHLTRIGNMSLHKTLPIQSQLKGCIAQKDKVIYWLAENDWRFRKDPIYMTVDLSNDVEHPNFGDASITTLAVGQFVKADTHIGKITFIEGTSVTVKWKENLDNISDELTAITKLEIGSRLDGYDGTVRVYCPNFYIKSQIIGSTRRVWLSTVKIDDTWTLQHEILIDAYKSTVLNTVPENMGYLSTLPVNSAVSVVNTAPYCRGGLNRPEYDLYLQEPESNYPSSTKDNFKTDLGKPRTACSRHLAREYARNAGSELLSYNQFKNIFYWLYVVEYANFNCKEEYNSTLTAEGYHQGGLGQGISNVTNWKSYNDICPLTPCGYGNDIGNGTSTKLISPYISPALKVHMTRWRGFDNPFGDIFLMLEGIVIEKALGFNNVWTTNDVLEYTDEIGSKILAGRECQGAGNIQLFDLGETAEIIPYVHTDSIGPTQYKCARHFTGNASLGLFLMCIGGRADTGSSTGLCFMGTAAAVSATGSDIGYRTVSSSVSFS